MTEYIGRTCRISGGLEGEVRIAARRTELTWTKSDGIHLAGEDVAESVVAAADLLGWLRQAGYLVLPVAVAESHMRVLANYLADTRDDTGLCQSRYDDSTDTLEAALAAALEGDGGDG